MELWLAQESDADKLLSENPFALLVGMVLDQQIPLEVAFRGPKKIADRMAALDRGEGSKCIGLDQQVPMETAFAGPKKIADRMSGFDPTAIADHDPDKFAALCSEKPAVHRFPGSMAKRIQALAQIIVDCYDGDAAALWTAGNPDGAELLRRLKGLPGFGEQKARIFLALLGKQYAVTPTGWRTAAGEYGEAGTHISVADIVDRHSLEQVRSYKKHQKQMKAAKSVARIGDPKAKGEAAP